MSAEHEPELSPEPRRVVVKAISAARQRLPSLKPGTAAKGRIDMGDQVGTLRVHRGDVLTVLTELRGALICRLHVYELLILTEDTEAYE